MRRQLLSACLLALLTAGIAAGVMAGMAAGLVWLFERPGPLAAARAIVVPRGPLALVALALQREGALPAGVGARDGFRLAARLTRADGPIHAAELRFPAHASVREVLHVLRAAPPVQHALTVPEGLNAAEIALLLNRSEALSGPTPVPAEGSVLPETYAYERDTTRTALVLRMQQAMRRRLLEIWAGRDPAAGLSTPSELLSMASMVERETALPAERPLVARVFLNRLRLGMRLQSDPTAAYAASGGLQGLTRPLGRADLMAANPYNTYAVEGLPPTPICAPGVAAMQAVAHPAASGALYFVADGSGGHAFAADLPQHLRNVARLRAREASPGASP